MLVNDIPEIITEFGEQYRITRGNKVFGLLSKGLLDGIGQDSDDAIESMIQDHKWTSSVLCIGQPPISLLSARLQGGSACALLVMENNYYIFDPHSTDIYGRPVDAGASVLPNFKTIRQCCSHIRQLGNLLNCNFYEVTTINMSHVHLNKYLDDTKGNQSAI